MFNNFGIDVCTAFVCSYYTAADWPRRGINIKIEKPYSRGIVVPGRAGVTIVSTL